MSLLKKQLGADTAPSNELPPVAEDGEIIMEPEAILDTRWVKKGSKIIEESLVKWKRLPEDDATWENTQEVQDRFINMNLGDKVSVKGWGIDKPRRSQRVSIRNPKYIDE